MLTRGAAPRRRLAMAGCGLLLGAAPVASAVACSADGREPVTLRVLASSELADMRPVLDDLRRATGVRLAMEYRGTAEAADELLPGRRRHDLAWLSSDRLLRLRLAASGHHAERPLSTGTMLSPVVIGLKRDTAARLRRSAGDGRLSWADLASGAAAGRVRFGMADPHKTNSGLAALIGVATAAAGTGGALRPQDVTCDRLTGFFTGQTFTADTSEALVDRFVGSQGVADGLIGYESSLLELNASGRLREPLEIVYPKDGIVVSEYPLLLLDPGKRRAYDKVVDWLKTPAVQQEIMKRTLRRPIDPEVTRDPRLREPIGNALYYPDSKAVVDRLLADYGDRDPGRVLFVLDFSGSMEGARSAALRGAFAGLGGADDSPDGKFVRFHRGEQVTVIRFGGRVLAERTFTVDGRGGMTALREFVAAGGFDGRTAIWSALDRAYAAAEESVRARPGRRVSMVLMTDGENNAGMSLDGFLRRHRAAAAGTVHPYLVRFGDADPAELDRAARAMGGRVVDGTSESLLNAFKETRGCR